ncbi:amidohydrolase family protein [Thermomonospora amylolytica]|uniref:amidohydrolase family protein n=1 Tax=Thermomonospora amylolytica TaxID=1411117 RepID=UPI000E6B5EA8|nr:amidohydrolase family protein [Thermomonospora amylolytica]
MNDLIVKGGLVIDTEPSPTVLGRVDVLISGGRIAALGPDLPHSPETEVIDATGRIVLPGFVDTHRHTWQAGIRMVLPDGTLPDYLSRVLGELAPAHTPEDIHTAQLAGALECLDAGITTVVDWSHIQFTPGHTDAALAALEESGVRAVFGYAYGGDGGPAGMTAEARRVREHVAASPAPLTMALAAFGPEIAGEEQALAEWRLARDLDLPVTVHMGAMPGLTFLDENGLLDVPTMYVHPNHFTDEGARLIADTGGSASLTPAIEAAMNLGHPATGRLRAAGVPSGLGADTVTAGPGDTFSLMRAAYLLERSRPTAGAPFTARDALHMATLEGARTAGLADVTGSLRPGKHADLILLRADTPAMAAAHDPIAAVVLSADTSTVDTVLVGGRIRKRDGRLVDHDLPALLTRLSETAHRVTTPA